MLALALLALTAAHAGDAYLQNDGFETDDEVGFQEGFVDTECWASVYVPDESQYPFTLRAVDLLVGGSTSQQIFIMDFYALAGTTMTAASKLGSEGVAISGSNESFSRIEVDELELSLGEINSGNVAVAVCLEGFDGLPAIARDTDGMDHADRNWIQIEGGDWYKSTVLGVQGDWIMRLCIEGDGIEGNECPEGDVDIDTDTDSDTDTDTDTDTDGELSLSSITPTSMFEGEPVDLVLIGSGFQAGAEARIGGISITGTDVVNSETIQGRAPSALPAGVHDVEVVGPDGQTAYLAGAFEVTGGCGCASSGGRAGGLLAAGLLGLLALGRRRP